jgi:CubicO group peptidase (beta-lactamase class C family)
LAAIRTLLDRAAGRGRDSRTQAISRAALYGAFVVLDELDIKRLVAAAGYEPATRVAVGVSSRSTTVFVAQAGAEARDFDCDSVAYAGSLAKQITGACAALLTQGGVLDVEAPIAEPLAELPRWAHTVRVRHLIHHTAGLPATDAVWEQMTSAGESNWTSDGVIAALSKTDELDEQPGDAYAYSNIGYICLARIIERLSGRALDAFAHEHLFRPLEMGTTTLWSGPEPVPPNAIPTRPLEAPAPLSVGDGGLWTSVSDLLRWNDSLLADTLGITETLHTTGALDDGTALDYGWGVRVFHVGPTRVQSHGGSWDSATSKLVRLPDLGISFAALADDGSVERMTALSAALQDELVSGIGTTP